jgi:hypothetical protein
VFLLTNKAKAKEINMLTKFMEKKLRRRYVGVKAKRKTVIETIRFVSTFLIASTL